MTDSPQAPKQVPRRKKDAALQYRWGVVGAILAIGFLGWYMSTKGVTLSPIQPGGGATANLEKILCPRCQNEEGRRENCALCGGLGHIWVNKDLDPGTGGRPAPQR